MLLQPGIDVVPVGVHTRTRLILPASHPLLCCALPAVLQAGMTIVPVGVDAQGNINIAEMRQKAELHKVTHT